MFIVNLFYYILFYYITLYILLYRNKNMFALYFENLFELFIIYKNCILYISILNNFIFSFVVLLY